MLLRAVHNEALIRYIFTISHPNTSRFSDFEPGAPYRRKAAKNEMARGATTLGRDWAPAPWKAVPLGEAAPLVPAGLTPLGLVEEPQPEPEPPEQPEPEPEPEPEGELVGEAPLDPEGTAAELEPAGAGEAAGEPAGGQLPPEPEQPGAAAAPEGAGAPGAGAVDSGLVPDGAGEGAPGLGAPEPEPEPELGAGAPGLGAPEPEPEPGAHGQEHSSRRRGWTPEIGADDGRDGDLQRFSTNERAAVSC